MVYFQTKNPNLGKFLRALDWKRLIYFMASWNILLSFGKFYDHLLHFALIRYIFSSFGITNQEKSGNPDRKAQAKAKPCTAALLKSGTCFGGHWDCPILCVCIPAVFINN
jgi:hypothetical protein